MRIVVYGRPAPQGSKRHVGKGVMIESSKHVKPWRECVRWSALAVRKGAPPLDGPLVVSMVFTLAKPKSAPKRRTIYPDRTPDLSKLVRSTEDALTDAGVWTDDARVIEYVRLAKVYPGEGDDALDAPGVVIEISAKVAA
jgi:Holliday junction resolvase RusA-like endonuclease